MSIDDYKEMHEYDDYEEDKSCNVCGGDYEDNYFYKGKWWCEDCLKEAFLYGDSESAEQIPVCDYCGEEITGNIYYDPDTEEYYCEECFFENIVGA